MNLKILSWNIWVDCKFDELTAFLDQSNADIISMQEVRTDDPSRDVVRFLEHRGYQSTLAIKQKFAETDLMFGLAVFSKYPILSANTHALSKEEVRYALQTNIDVGGITLHVFNTHLMHTHQKPSPTQEEQARTLAGLLPTERALVMGDFNATHESETIRIMSALRNTDPSNAPTWSMYPEGCPVCAPEKPEIRLDYIFATQDLTTHSPAVHHSPASDHLPISVQIE